MPATPNTRRKNASGIMRLGKRRSNNNKHNISGQAVDSGPQTPGKASQQTPAADQSPSRSPKFKVATSSVDKLRHSFQVEEQKFKKERNRRKDHLAASLDVFVEEPTKQSSVVEQDVKTPSTSRRLHIFNPFRSNKKKSPRSINDSKHSRQDLKRSPRHGVTSPSKAKNSKVVPSQEKDEKKTEVDDSVEALKPPSIPQLLETDTDKGDDAHHRRTAFGDASAEQQEVSKRLLDLTASRHDASRAMTKAPRSHSQQQASFYSSASSLKKRCSSSRASSRNLQDPPEQVAPKTPSGRSELQNSFSTLNTSTPTQRSHSSSRRLVTPSSSSSSRRDSSRHRAKRELDDRAEQILVKKVLAKYPRAHCQGFDQHLRAALDYAYRLVDKSKYFISPRNRSDFEERLGQKLKLQVGDDESIDFTLGTGSIEDDQLHCSRESLTLDAIANLKSPRSPSTMVSSIGGGNSRDSLLHASITTNGTTQELSAIRRRSVPTANPQEDERARKYKASGKSGEPASPGGAGMVVTTAGLKSPRGGDDWGSSLVSVKRLHMTDPAGSVGRFTGYLDSDTGKSSGKGRMDYVDGGYYEGEWRDGAWNGKGNHVKPNGDSYEGTFLDHAKHGLGVYTYGDGKRVFEGRYVQGQRAEGTMKYQDGSVYIGQWYKGKRHGRGDYTFSDGSIYKGEFVKDRIHGAGELTWPDGGRYDGEWNKGKRHGMGREYLPDGSLRFEGVWREGVPLS